MSMTRRTVAHHGHVELSVLETAGRRHLGKCWDLEDHLLPGATVQLNAEEAAVVAKELAVELDAEELLEAAVTHQAAAMNERRYGKAAADAMRLALLHALKAVKTAKASSSKDETRRLERGNG